jgi:hypothetical protein
MIHSLAGKEITAPAISKSKGITEFSFSEQELPFKIGTPDIIG